MAEIEPTQFAGFPYYDDYQDSKKFIKMLFKPGYALQARELTQLQTVLQKQISRFANHIFKDGSPVVDGQLGVVTCDFIRIETEITGSQGSIEVIPSQFIGKTIVNKVNTGASTPQLRMKVLHAEEKEKDNTADPYHVLFVEYQNSAEIVDPATGEKKNITNLKDLYETITGAPTILSVVTVVDGTEEVSTDIQCQIKTEPYDADKIATFGKATLMSNQDGIYYIDGAFIMASAQTIALKRKSRLRTTVLGEAPDPADTAVETEWTSSPGEIPENPSFIGEGWVLVTGEEEDLVGVRLFQFPSSRVGFTIKREVIDADADKTLLDPAYGSYNYAAPGSDRYKVDLILDQLIFTNQDTLSDPDQYKTTNFVELTRVVDGTVRYSVKYPIYSDLEETLARRTYDESGSYTVKPFQIDIEEYFNNEKTCLLRSTPKEIVAGTAATPYTVRNEEGTSVVAAGFPANLSVYGYRLVEEEYYLAWKGIVSDADTFIARHGEVDFRAEGYGTTLMHMIFGTPVEGDIMVSESYTKENNNTNLFFLKSQIPITGDVFDDLYTLADGAHRKILSQEGEDPQDYLAGFPHVGQFIDPRFAGKYTLGRLHPEWGASAEDPSSVEVIDAIEDAKSKLVVGVGTGKAYIYGYEFENQNTKFIPIDKARTSEQVKGEQVKLSLGNYVVCKLPTGDSTAPNDLRLPSWSSHPKVELWNELDPSGVTPNTNGKTLVGTARIRGVTPNENGVNVHLCDVLITGNSYFADFDHIRFRYKNTALTGDNAITGTVELFDISLTGGTEKTEVVDAEGNSIVYHDTVLFAPKANFALFDLPSLSSLKEIEEFAKVKYDCKKSFTKQLINGQNGAGPTIVENTSLKWKAYGDLCILTNISGNGVGIAANTQGTSEKTLYTFKTSTAADEGLQTALRAALGTNTTFYKVDDPESILLFNANTNEAFSVSEPGPNSLITAVVNQEKTVMYIMYKKTGTTDPLGISNPFHAEIIVSAQAQEGNNTTNFRKKTASVISEYDDGPSGTWNKYFNDDGYFMVPLQNWDGIFQIVGSDESDDPWVGNYTPGEDNGWDDWEGDDDEGSNNPNTNSFTNSSLPEEYITSLGISDVISIDEVVAWDSTAPTGKRDITKYFRLVDGINDNFYDHSKIVITKSSLKTLKAQTGMFKNLGGELDYTLFVRFKFFKHSGSGPFTLTSYEHNDHHPFFVRYEDIPLHISPTFGYSFELRNCLDYRPSRENSTPARVATALADMNDFTSSDTNRPNALDEDCPLRDNSLIQENNEAFVVRTERGESETVLPALGINNSQPSITYNYYIPRRDKLVLLKTRELKIFPGNPSMHPASPKDVPESMSLYTLVLPQYTFGPETVVVDYIDNKRFTMNDIAKLEKRIERVEYYTTLSLLEKEAAELSIPDPALGGAERIKNGIFVDNFKGHGVGDVFSPYYSCSMDFENGHLRPRFRTRHVEFEPILPSTNFKISPDGVITLFYEDDAPNQYIVQPIASRAISVNPFDIVSWLGSASLEPSSDTWIDTRTRPAVTINLEGENDSWAAMRDAFGTQWNDWETTWTGVRASTTEAIGAPRVETTIQRAGRRIDTTVTSTQANLVTETIENRQTRQGIRTIVTPQRVTRELGDRVVDVSVVPFIRARRIVITGISLKPNTVLHAFFDNTSVNKYCEVNGQPVTPSNPIKTDPAGEVEVVFNLPGGTFKTGERQFRLTDSATNNLPQSNTSADASYFAQGMLQTKENTIVSTRVPIVRRESVTDERVVRDAVTRVQNTVSSQTTTRWTDPLAQTFLVDFTKSPKGVWVHSIDLFFKNAPSGDSAPPVRVQIRPTVNGYPHSSMILPFAEVFKNANEVNLANGLDPSQIPSVNNNKTYTRFKFSTPVYLIPGEYSIVVMSNSAEYECYISEMGEVALGTEGTRITQQPYAGVFFKSQNASTWSADQNADLMFAINTCEFNTPDEPVSIDFKPVVGQYGFADNNDNFEVDLMKIVCQQLKFDDSTVTAKLVLTDNNSRTEEFDIPLNENFAPRPVAFELDAQSKLRLQFTNSDPYISPCIDSERLSVILIDNIVGPADPNNLPLENSARPIYDIDDPLHPVARYISRRVDLNPGLECDDLKVYLTANLPNFSYATSPPTEIKTAIEVWAKVQTADSDVPFEDLNWMRMDVNPLQATQVATDEGTFAEYSFTIPEKVYPSSSINTGYSKAEQQFAVPFTRYSIKIMMYSNNGTIVPKVKDLRVIAVV